MKRKKSLAARLVADLRPALEGWADPVAYGIGFDGAVYAAARRSTEATAKELSTGIFPKSRLDQPTDYLVVRWQDGQLRTLVVPGESMVVSYVQPFPGGVLLAGARCFWRAEGAEKNAFAVDWSGRELARFTLGDGIQDLRTTRDGTIWTSYFDEGVFGNYGWGSPGPAPIGETGLMAFSSTGDARFAYDHAAARTDSVVDAYAMNVVGEAEVWLYFYTEFPIVRILDGAYHVWNPDVAGARALAVREDRVLLFGDYKHHNLGRIVELGRGSSAKVVGEVKLVDNRGEPLTRALPYGVAGNLFFFKERSVLLAEDW